MFSFLTTDDFVGSLWLVIWIILIGYRGLTRVLNGYSCSNLETDLLSLISQLAFLLAKSLLFSIAASTVGKTIRALQPWIDLANRAHCVIATVLALRTLLRLLLTCLIVTMIDLR